MPRFMRSPIAHARERVKHGYAMRQRNRRKTCGVYWWRHDRSEADHVRKSSRRFAALHRDAHASPSTGFFVMAGRPAFAPTMPA